MGPIWDFDLSAGNVLNQPLGRGPEDLYVALFNYWYRYLMQRPEFFEAVVSRWNEIKDREIAQTIEHVRQLAITYQDEFERNFERHPILGAAIPRVPTAPEMLEIDSFMGHVDFLLDWIETRRAWLDNFFNGRLPGHDPLWALVEYHTYHHPINITVDGIIHETDFIPINLQNRVMVPVQDLAEIFDIGISYSTSMGIFALQREDITIVHRMGELGITVNGERLYFDVPGSLYIGEYMYFPLRIIAEILGYDIRWHFGTRQVMITTTPMAQPVFQYEPPIINIQNYTHFMELSIY